MKRFVEFRSLFFLPTTVLFLLLSVAYGQHSPLVRSMDYSKGDVEKALRQLQEYSEGKLPIVDGFVVPGAEPSDRFQRAYYSIAFSVTSPVPSETVVKATAKITAWYAGDSSALSGYRALPSNGRLESDIFDRLQQLLPATHSSAEPLKPAENTHLSSESLPQAPDSHLQASSASGTTGKLPTITAPANPIPPAATRTDGSTARIRQLNEERSALEEIARNQSHPDNLASVLTSHTAVVTQPVAGAHLLFYAEAQDEFPVLGTKGNWVHVTISGISRGWIRRSQLDMSAVSSGISGAAQVIPTTAEPFRSTREETSSFPGTWAPLQGKSVKVIWVEPATQSEGNGTLRLKYAMSLMRKASQAKQATEAGVDGVVIVFDSAEGGMVAATTASLKRWQDGGLTDASFEKQCWFSPVEAFANSQP